MLYIFDMGNVVSHHVDVLPEMSMRLRISEARILDYCGRDFSRLSTGSISTEEFWRDFSDFFDISIEEDLLRSCFHPEIDPNMVGLIEELKATGHRLVCGTNTLESHYRYHLNRGDYNIFDLVYSSHIIGVMKPDPDFFRYILQAEHNPPENSIFIDDLEDNIRSAASLGIHAIRFTSFEELLKALSERTGEEIIR